jgi:2,4-dienoyl-CoA reductase (NADPH2)
VGARVAIIGAGGIGFDVAEYLVHQGHSPTLDAPAWYAQWGIDATLGARGGLAQARPPAPARKVWLLQRSTGKLGERLNKTSGWVHRSTLKMARVEMIGGASYERIDAQGLHIVLGGQPRLLEVDHVVICAGQEPNRELSDALAARGITLHRIGGADVAAELDAKRAIDQGTRLAAGM